MLQFANASVAAALTSTTTAWYWAPVLGALATIVLGTFLEPVAESLNKWWIWLYAIAMDDPVAERGDAWEYIRQLEADLQSRGYRPSEIGLQLLVHLVRTIPGDSFNGICTLKGRPGSRLGTSAFAVVLLSLTASWAYGTSTSRLVITGCWVAVGCAALVCTARVRYDRWRVCSLLLLATVVVMLCLVIVPQGWS